jgi:hypothetical protein
MSRRRKLGLVAAAAALIGCAAAAGCYFDAPRYGFNMIARRGASVWVAITLKDLRIGALRRPRTGHDFFKELNLG